MTKKDWDRIYKEKFSDREWIALRALKVGRPKVKMSSPVPHQVLETINSYLIRRQLPYRIRKQVRGLDGHHKMVKVRV